MGPTLDDTIAALTNHKPSEAAVARIERIRGAAQHLAITMHREAPETPERSTALTHLRTTVMFAVQSVILDDIKADKEVPVTDKRGAFVATQPPFPWGSVLGGPMHDVRNPNPANLL